VTPRRERFVAGLVRWVGLEACGQGSTSLAGVFFCFNKILHGSVEKLHGTVNVRVGWFGASVGWFGRVIFDFGRCRSRFLCLLLFFSRLLRWRSRHFNSGAHEYNAWSPAYSI